MNGKVLSSFLDCLDLGLTCLPKTQCFLPFLKKICFGLLRFNRQLVSEITKFHFEGVPEKTCVCCSYLCGYKHKSCIHCVVGLGCLTNSVKTTIAMDTIFISNATRVQFAMDVSVMLQVSVS